MIRLYLPINLNERAGILSIISKVGFIAINQKKHVVKICHMFFIVLHTKKMKKLSNFAEK